MGIVRNNNDRKRAEQVDQFIRGMLETSPLAVHIMRKSDMKLTFVNQSFCEMTHCSREEAPVLFYRFPEDFEGICRRLEREEKLLNHQVELVSKGHEIWALVSYFNLEYEGEPSIIGWFYDVTDLIHARNEADSASRAKSEFLSNMSHELRTPMNAILGFGQILKFDDTLSEENKDSVNEILTAGNHLMELINDLLDVAG